MPHATPAKETTAQPPEARTGSARPLIALLWILTACYGVAFLGAQASFQGLAGWYQALNKPAWTPPGWLFGPVWTVLYGLMGVAAWHVWRAAPSPARTRGLALFAGQLVLNGLWSWLFFAWRRLDFAFYEIVALWLAIAATMVAFARLRPVAAALLAPYLAWVSFATLLAYAIWRANPS